MLFKNETIFAKFVKPVCLPRTSQANELSDGTIAGWGQAIAERDTENVPLTSQLSVSQCKEVSKERLSPRTFCASAKNTSACQGDSGDFNRIIFPSNFISILIAKVVDL